MTDSDKLKQLKELFKQASDYRESVKDSIVGQYVLIETEKHTYFDLITELRGWYASGVLSYGCDLQDIVRLATKDEFDNQIVERWYSENI